MPLPNLANPGDPFTGTASFFGPVPTFTISVNGQTWGANAMFPEDSFVSSTQVFIDINGFGLDGPYGVNTGHAGLSASLVSGTGSFTLAGDNEPGTAASVSGNITSFGEVSQAVPDSGSTLALLTLGLIAAFGQGTKILVALRNARLE